MLVVMVSVTVLSFAKQSSNKSAKLSLQQMEWLHDGTGDPTDNESYTPFTGPGGLAAICGANEEICGIVAPLDPSSSPSNPKPSIDSSLANRIQTEDTSNNDVFLLP